MNYTDDVFDALNESELPTDEVPSLRGLTAEVLADLMGVSADKVPRDDVQWYVSRWIEDKC